MNFLDETRGKDYTGSCHCGAIKIAMKGPLRPFVICHCKDCLGTAGFSWAAAQLPHEQLEVKTGVENLDWYASSHFAKRGFCKTCHAQMFFKNNDSDFISVSVGMFDNFDGMRVSGHIFRKSMPDCCHKIDDLPDIDVDFYAASDGQKD